MAGGSELDIVRNQLLSGNVQSGSILARVLNELPAQQLQELRTKAAEGMLGLELEKVAMSQRFQSSSIEIREFIERIKELERASVGRFSTYKATGEFETASGKTTIESKKGCYIATAVYGSQNHQQVVLLRNYRDVYLLKSRIGYQFCKSYYKVSPYLAKYFYFHPIKIVAKVILDAVCIVIRNRFRRNRIAEHT